MKKNNSKKVENREDVYAKTNKEYGKQINKACGDKMSKKNKKG